MIYVLGIICVLMTVLTMKGYVRRRWLVGASTAANVVMVFWVWAVLLGVA